MDTPGWPDPQMLAGFVTERADFFRIGVMETAHGFDVVLRIDGTYRLAADARRIARHLGTRLAAVLSPDVRRKWARCERECAASRVARADRRRGQRQSLALDSAEQVHFALACRDHRGGGDSETVCDRQRRRVEVAGTHPPEWTAQAHARPHELDER